MEPGKSLGERRRLSFGFSHSTVCFELWRDLSLWQRIFRRPQQDGIMTKKTTPELGLVLERRLPNWPWGCKITKHGSFVLLIPTLILLAPLVINMTWYLPIFFNTAVHRLIYCLIDWHFGSWITCHKSQVLCHWNGLRQFVFTSSKEYIKTHRISVEIYCRTSCQCLVLSLKILIIANAI